MRIIVLGAGMVGSAIAKDLAQESDFSVTVVDLSQQALAKLEEEASIVRIQADLEETEAISSIVG